MIKPSSFIVEECSDPVSITRDTGIGHFEFGGSTHMTIFQPDRVRLADWAVNAVIHRNDPNPTPMGSIILAATRRAFHRVRVHARYRSARQGACQRSSKDALYGELNIESADWRSPTLSHSRGVARDQGLLIRALRRGWQLIAGLPQVVARRSRDVDALDTILVVH